MYISIYRESYLHSSLFVQIHDTIPYMSGDDDANMFHGDDDNAADERLRR